MIDSGRTGNFVPWEVVNKLNLKAEKLVKPYIVGLRKEDMSLVLIVA